MRSRAAYTSSLDQVTGEQILRTRRFVRRFLEQYFAPNDLGAVVAVEADASQLGLVEKRGAMPARSK